MAGLVTADLQLLSLYPPLCEMLTVGVLFSHKALSQLLALKSTFPEQTKKLPLSCDMRATRSQLGTGH